MSSAKGTGIVPLAVSPNQSTTLKALGDFIVAVLPAGVAVFQSQDNRVPQPKDANSVEMTPLRMPRLATNVDGDADALFTASIAGTMMTVTAVPIGAITVGATVYGTGVAANTTVAALGTGSGSVGTYDVSPSQVAALGTMAAGLIDVEQATEVVVQLDFYGPQSPDNAKIVSTLFRDDYACRFFAALDGAPDITPLYAEDPRQGPFISAEQHYENRWMVEVAMQANEVVTVPQQYASAVEADVISVEATYPSS